METLNTIIPIFAVILLGLLAKKRGFIPPSFVSPANRLTYYLAIPALIFRAIAKSDFHTKFDSWLLMGTLLPLLIVYGVFWIVFLVLGVASKSRGTLIESTIHGNIGYIALAIVFYYLGTEALATAGILAGFVMLTHNSLAVIVLQLHSGNQGTGHGMKQILTKIIGNPIILTAIVSILFSLAQLQIPVIIDRTLAVIGNLALPLALLLIGASLSFRIQTRQLFLVLMVSFAKLIVLPALGLWFYVAFHLQPEMYLPGLILLSAPVATVSYILATEMNGDPKMAVSIISISTALSALSITFWLAITV
jgi:hypothetical protein